MQAITFDATGTLITTTRPVGETYAQIAMSFGCELTVDALSQGFATVFPADADACLSGEVAR